MSELAIYYEPDAYSFKYNVMGRQSAGIGFFGALARAAPKRLWCFARSREKVDECARSLGELGVRDSNVVWVPFLAPEKLSAPGLLYRPDPMIEEQAWQRLQHASPRSYSLCGITHTTASHDVTGAIARLPLAPFEPWDALICTSRAVRDSVRLILESQTEYLRERTGATRFTLPQLPVIPLGVHCDQFRRGESQREQARRELGIEPDELVVLFVGRLTFAGKAHPVPMFLALEECAKDRKITLVQAGWFPNEGTEHAFVEEEKAICPNVRSIHVDGKSREKLTRAWSAADVFISLSDNIQETFGLTPIEAMASGLPTLVSDWDGYRDTVRDGVDGFRLPTLSLPSGSGNELAERYELRYDNYDYYCGLTSQLVAVDVHATAAALKRLIENPDLRRTMGESGRRRALEQFDWAVIYRRYQALWDELQERRRSDATLFPKSTKRRRPDKPDPFHMFASYPTSVVGSATEFRVRSRSRIAPKQLRELASVRFAQAVLPSQDLVEMLLAALADGVWRSFDTLAGAVQPTPPLRTARALVWLTKMGVLHHRAAPSPGRGTGAAQRVRIEPTQ